MYQKDTQMPLKARQKLKWMNSPAVGNTLFTRARKI